MFLIKSSSYQNYVASYASNPLPPEAAFLFNCQVPNLLVETQENIIISVLREYLREDVESSLLASVRFFGVFGFF